MDAFNILNRHVSDINYYYVSRLPGEPATGIADLHTHPAERRSARIAGILQPEATRVRSGA